MITILVALWTNFHGVFVVALIIATATAVVLGGLWMIEADYASITGASAREVASAVTYKRFFKCAAIATALFAVLTAIPDVDDLWRARIALLKLELASPENAQKGIEEIARIARKLECKYLGCEEEKEKP